MGRGREEIARYALYGESGVPMAPEFLHIEDIPSRSALYDWVIAPHTHQGIFQLLLITSGGAGVDIDGVRSDIAAPALIFVPSNCVHAFSFSAGTQGWVLSVATDLLGDPRLGPFGARLQDRVTQGHVRGLSDQAEAADRLSWLLGDMAQRMRSAHGVVPDMVTLMLGAVLGVALEALGGEDVVARHPHRHVRLVRNFEALVDRDYRAHLSVAAYAQRLAVAPPTLTRACRAVLNKAPGDIILDRLLLEAMRYLRHTAASAKQISDQLGFADPAYFARFFKARSGMTTREFRISLTEGGGSALSTKGAVADSAAA